jgi:cytochrome c-type biogenesis protein CcmH
VLRLAVRLKSALPFSLGEKVAGEARRMRARRSEKRALRADPHPNPSPRRALGRAPVSRRAMGEGKRALFLLPLLAVLASPALAVQPDEVMKDPALETRARALSGELRCLVCQNESIDDSEAPLARDIRILIRERIGKGESNDAVRDYLVSRYGDFILLKPPFKPGTLLLWLSPVLTLGLGVAAALYARRRAPSATPRLSPEEEAQLAALTNGDASNG